MRNCKASCGTLTNEDSGICRSCQSLIDGDLPVYMSSHTGVVDDSEGWAPYTPDDSDLIQVRWDSKTEEWEEVS